MSLEKLHAELVEKKREFKIKLAKAIRKFDGGTGTSATLMFLVQGFRE